MLALILIFGELFFLEKNKKKNISLSEYNALACIGSPPVSSFIIPSIITAPLDGSCITAYLIPLSCITSDDVPPVPTRFSVTRVIGTVPLYSPFGLETQTGTRISVGNLTYDIGEIASLMEPLNIAGYQITKNTCFDCPYSERLFATYSQYTYKPRQQFYLDDRMKGDTLSVYAKATFNTDKGWREVRETELKIIID